MPEFQFKPQKYRKRDRAGKKQKEFEDVVYVDVGFRMEGEETYHEYNQLEFPFDSYWFALREHLLSGMTNAKIDIVPTWEEPLEEK